MSTTTEAHATATETTSNKAAAEWVNEFYHVVDSLEIDETVAAALLTPGASMSVANYPIVEGRGEILQFFKWLFGGLESMDHDIKEVRVCEGLIVAIIVVSWSFSNGTSGSAKACTVIRKECDEKQAHAVEVYANLSEMMDGVIRTQEQFIFPEDVPEETEATSEETTEGIEKGAKDIKETTE